MFTTYKYRLNPNKVQAEVFKQWEGSTRWLWNRFLEKTTEQYAINKQFIWGYELKRLIPGFKQTNPWLKNTPSSALQNVAFDIDQALRRATCKNRDLGFPHTKKKGRDYGAITMNQVNNTHITDSHIKLPKLGLVRWHYHRPITGKLKEVSITLYDNHWWVSVVCEVPDVTPMVEIDKTKTIGIDLGVKSFATLSDGTHIPNQHFLKSN